MLVVLVSGKQGSGKTTLSDSLMSELTERGYNTYRTRFAKVLYEIHDAAVAVAQKYGIQAGPKEGEMLQWLGTEWGRNLKGQNVWVDALKTDLKMAEERGVEVVIIDDCRFENELDFTKENVVRIRLEAPTNVRKARCSYWRENDTHPSETSLDHRLDSFDLVLDTSKVNAEEVLNTSMKLIFGQLPVDALSY